MLYCSLHFPLTALLESINICDLLIFPYYILPYVQHSVLEIST